MRASRPWTRLRRADIRLTDAGTARASVDVAGYVATYVATNPLAFSSPGPALAGFERGMAQFEESAPSTSRRTHALTGPALARNEDMATLGTTLGATFGAMTLAAGAEEPDPSSPIISTIFGMFSPKPAEVPPGPDSPSTRAVLAAPLSVTRDTRRERDARAAPHAALRAPYQAFTQHTLRVA